jgi:hypothetical protein
MDGQTIRATNDSILESGARKLMPHRADLEGRIHCSKETPLIDSCFFLTLRSVYCQSCIQTGKRDCEFVENSKEKGAWRQMHESLFFRVEFYAALVRAARPKNDAITLTIKLV